MAMSTDSELKKILLREQDLRFVTDTLTQYLGQKAKEREFYAKERAVERKEEKALAAKGSQNLISVWDEASKSYKLVKKEEGLTYQKAAPETDEEDDPDLFVWELEAGGVTTGTKEEAEDAILKKTMKAGTTYYKQGTGIPKKSTTTAPLTSTQMKSGLIESINNRLDDTSIGRRKKDELRRIKKDIENMTTDIDESTYKDYETKIGAKYDTGKLSQKQKQYRNTAKTHRHKRNNIASRYRDKMNNTILNVMDWSIPDKRESIKAYGEEQKYEIMTVYPEMTGIKIYTTQYTDDGLEVLGSDTAFVEWQLDVEKSTKISDEKKKEFLSWTKEEFRKAMQENQDKNDYEENPGTPYFIIIDEPQIPPSILDLISKDKD